LQNVVTWEARLSLDPRLTIHDSRLYPPLAPRPSPLAPRQEPDAPVATAQVAIVNALNLDDLLVESPFGADGERNDAIFMVVPGLSWVKVETPAVEVDGGFVVFDIAEAADASLDGHDLAVDSLGHAVGDFVRAIADDVG
jgi:hypothetical protein